MTPSPRDVREPFIVVDERSIFSLRYAGSVTPAGLDAYTLIQLLTVFRKLWIKSSRTVYGSESRTSFHIAHVQPGSLDIQGIIELVAGLQPVFAQLPILSLGLSDIPELIKAWLDILKFLKGRPPQKVQNVHDGNALQIENSKGDVQVVNGNVYNTLIFNDIGTIAEKLATPIRSGATELNLVRGRQIIASYDANDVAAFQPIRPQEEPISSEIEASLQVVAPVLEGEGVWRFKYGRSSLTAKLQDEDYRRKVIDGSESFRHGDLLRVRLRTVQENVGRRLSTKHFITRVVGRV